jgi:hypothetical protein
LVSGHRQIAVKNMTEKRQGVWYARKRMQLYGYNLVKKCWVHIRLDEGSEFVFLEDLTENENFRCGHLFYLKGETFFHPRVNSARWRKKFEQ